jgi:antitoxin YefM
MPTSADGLRAHIALEGDSRAGRQVLPCGQSGSWEGWPSLVDMLRSSLRAHDKDVQFPVQKEEVWMKTLSYTESRARYAEVLDSVINDREEVVVTRAGHEPVVIVSLADFESLRETAYLMRSPTNARRLLDAMERLESGRGEAHDLLDAD